MQKLSSTLVLTATLNLFSTFLHAREMPTPPQVPEIKTNPEELDAAAMEMERILKEGDRLHSQKRLSELSAIHASSVQLKFAQLHYEGLAGQKPNHEAAAKAFALARQNGMPPELQDSFELAKLARQTTQADIFAYVAVKHIKQGYNMCAPTSAAMVLTYGSGQPVDPLAIKLKSKGAETPGTGTAWDFLKLGIKAVSGQDWNFQSFPVTDEGFNQGFTILRREVEASRPVLIDLGPHTVVFVGYDAKKKLVYIQNPAYEWPGVHTLSYEQFRDTWRSPWHLSTTGGIEARPILLTPANPKSEIK